MEAEKGEDKAQPNISLAGETPAHGQRLSCREVKYYVVMTELSPSPAVPPLIHILIYHLFHFLK